MYCKSTTFPKIKEWSLTTETMNEQISEFAVTFGVQYKHQPHPVFQQSNVADGYVVIEAPDEEQAREISNILFNDEWSMIYDDSDPRSPKNSEYFPLGEIARYSWEADQLIDTIESIL